MIRCELFVRDLEASTLFYETYLVFKVVPVFKDDHVTLRSAWDELSLNATANLPETHYFCRNGALFAPRGVGVEIVLERPNMVELYESIRSVGTVQTEPLQDRPWGLRDFRLVDLDGYYVRVSEPRRE